MAIGSPGLSNKSDTGQTLGRLGLVVELKLRFQAGLMVPAKQYPPGESGEVCSFVPGWMDAA
jgi:hypothetical protein